MVTNSNNINKTKSHRKSFTTKQQITTYGVG